MVGSAKPGGIEHKVGGAGPAVAMSAGAEKAGKKAKKKKKSFGKAAAMLKRVVATPATEAVPT